MCHSTIDDVKKAQFIARGVGMKERDGKESVKDKVIFVASYKLQGSILKGYGRSPLLLSSST
jgi:hypothetical protein